MVKTGDINKRNLFNGFVGFIILQVIFCIFYYGRTPYVISFNAVFGIISVLIMPFAGLPYKLSSLALLFWVFSFSRMNLIESSARLVFK